MIAAQKEAYKEYLRPILQTEGFSEFFTDNNRTLTRKQISDKWGEEFANHVFTQDKYVFIPSLLIKVT